MVEKIFARGHEWLPNALKGSDAGYWILPVPLGKALAIGRKLGLIGLLALPLVSLVKVPAD